MAFFRAAGGGGGAKDIGIQLTMNSRARARTASSRGLSKPARSSASCTAGGKRAAVVANGNVGSLPRAGGDDGGTSGGLNVTPLALAAEVGARDSIASSWRSSVGWLGLVEGFEAAWSSG